MKAFRDLGFTLIELLTVIAIIAILAGLTVTVGPRIIERSKWTHFKTTCNQLKTAFTGYGTKNAVRTKFTYPPAYGLRDPGDPNLFFFKPYLAMIDEFGNKGLYDIFATGSYNTDKDPTISLLEFSPLGTKRTGGYVFATPAELRLYPGPLPNGDPPPGFEAAIAAMKTMQRPYVYIPVDSAQAQKAREYWQVRVAGIPGRELEAGNALHWKPDEVFPASVVPAGKVNNPIASLTGRFPPSKYDDFVLITPGPSGSTGGILTAPPSFMNDIAALNLMDQYHILALRAFFLATRDMDNRAEEPGPNMSGNGKFDFDYRNRTRGTDGKAASYKVADLYKLPDGTAGGGAGIYQCAYPDGA
jgi:prepilin-type N-terminal cleavage/methylation domain-containing protein